MAWTQVGVGGCQTGDEGELRAWGWTKGSVEDGRKESANVRKTLWLTQVESPGFTSFNNNESTAISEHTRLEPDGTDQEYSTPEAVS